MKYTKFTQDTNNIKSIANTIITTADNNKKLILDAEEYIRKNPETGFKEYKTTEYIKNTLKDMGYDAVTPKDITGCYTIADTQKPGPTILIPAELDSVICQNHPDCNPTTGAAHACGHNAQCAALIGIAAILKNTNIMDSLCGRIMLCAVPAEELLEIEYRAKLKREGKIKYYTGKCEYLSRGYFDNVDIAFMVHSAPQFSVTKGAVGCITKQIVYKGQSAHAGGAPQDGINALYGATCGINAINAVRETFKEEDIIRVHPIITHGGDTVNSIPDTVSLESYVRGVSFDAIKQANKKVNCALCGGALSLHTNIRITDTLGYAPLTNNTDLIKITKTAAEYVIPNHDFYVTDTIGSGSTDMGDLSCIMPVVHPYAKGATGKNHGSDYKIADPISACVDSAKLQTAMLYLLLCDNAKKAKEVIKNHKPLFKSKDAYLAYADSLYQDGERITYGETDIKVKL